MSRPKCRARLKPGLSDADVYRLLDDESSEVSMDDTSDYKPSASSSESEDNSSSDEEIIGT